MKINESVKGELEGVAKKEFVREDFYEMSDEIHSSGTKIVRAIYISKLVQFLAIVGSVIAIIHIMLRK